MKNIINTEKLDNLRDLMRERGVEDPVIDHITEQFEEVLKELETKEETSRKEVKKMRSTTLAALGGMTLATIVGWLYQRKAVQLQKKIVTDEQIRQAHRRAMDNMMSSMPTEEDLRKAEDILRQVLKF